MKTAIRRWLKKTSPKMRREARAAIDAGWRFEISAGRHVTAYSPDGIRRWVTAWSPSDHRSALNAASDLRRAMAAYEAAHEREKGAGQNGG